MSSFESGKAKIAGIISFEDLPKNRMDPIWLEVRTECCLTLAEASSLKNAACPSPGAAVESVLLEEIQMLRQEVRQRSNGNKGATTYSDFKQSLSSNNQFCSSVNLDGELAAYCVEFRRKVGCVLDGFSFADSNTVPRFPAEVIAAKPRDKILREASALAANEKAASKSNAALMKNLKGPTSAQDFVSAVLVLLKEDRAVYRGGDGDGPRTFKMCSFPEPMAYSRKSFGNRSPDIPFWSRPNTTSPHCITFILDVKPAEFGEFTDEQVGHIVDMARELLATEQRARIGIICGLTDGSRFQFFRVLRDDTAQGIVVEASRTFTGMEGWEVLIALMALPVDSEFLMHEEHRVEGLELHIILGHGSRSTVYGVRRDAEEGEGKTSGEGFLLPPLSFCKIYANPPAGVQGEGWRGFDRESAALYRLKDVQHIPKIVRTTTTFQPEKVGKGDAGAQKKCSSSSSSGAEAERVLVLSPVGLPLWPPLTLNDVEVTGRHFAQLVTTVEEMHRAGVLHRDIKPANVFLEQGTGGQLLLADFDAAVVLQKAQPAPAPAPAPASLPLQGRVQTRSAAAAPVGSLTLEKLTLEDVAPEGWRLDQQFVWVGTEGYSDTRPIGKHTRGLHTPTPEHDLVALVRTVHCLVYKMNPSGPDDCDAFWAGRMPPSSLWWKCLQMARGREYSELRAALAEL